MARDLMHLQLCMGRAYCDGTVLSGDYGDDRLLNHKHDTLNLQSTNYTLSIV